MKIDISDVLSCAIADFGQTISVDLAEVQALFFPAPSEADVYLIDPDLHKDAHDGPVAIFLQSALEAVQRWPLTSDIVTVDGIDYRIVRSSHELGDVVCYLREA